MKFFVESCFACLGLMSFMQSVLAANVEGHHEALPASQKSALDNVKVIDMHVHTGTFENMGAEGKDFILSAMPGFIPRFLKEFAASALGNRMLSAYDPLIGIKKESEKAGLEHVGLLSLYAPRTWGIASNEFVMNILDDARNRNKHGGQLFFGLASLDVETAWDTQKEQELSRLSQALKHPLMRGIKLAFAHNNVPLSDARFDPIYEVARAYNVPVYHHTGSSPLRKLSSFPSDSEKQKYIASLNPRNLISAIEKYPDVVIILGHMGFDFNNEGVNFLEDSLDLAEKYPNVWLEISAFGRKSYDPDGKVMDYVLTQVREKGLITRTIYGSDGPGFPGGLKGYLERVKESMVRVGYTQAEANLILWENSRKLFKLK